MVPFILCIVLITVKIIVNTYHKLAYLEAYKSVHKSNNDFILMKDCCGEVVSDVKQRNCLILKLAALQES
jgi:hypothetical protein